MALVPTSVSSIKKPVAPVAKLRVWPLPPRRATWRTVALAPVTLKTVVRPVPTISTSGRLSAVRLSPSVPTNSLAPMVPRFVSPTFRVWLVASRPVLASVMVTVLAKIITARAAPPVPVSWLGRPLRRPACARPSEIMNRLISVPATGSGPPFDDATWSSPTLVS